ncbi:MAG: hypothetical protein CM1200mP28_16960 [Deltaproteobacteria bacterium]|nr:MAG: hypothetical protein CM1200mP28_16960 [Deltaproteobacteria bacterium]
MKLKPEGETLQFRHLGLGKLGGKEMTYHSDLDLIFIHSGKGFPQRAFCTGTGILGSK